MKRDLLMFENESLISSFLALFTFQIVLIAILIYYLKETNSLLRNGDAGFEKLYKNLENRNQSPLVNTTR